MRKGRILRRKKYLIKHIDFNMLIFFTMAAVLLFGAVFGSAVANSMGEESFNRLSRFWNEFLFEGMPADRNFDIFYECIFKYGKFAFIIWLLGFISIGWVGIMLALFGKGVSVGFTTAFIIKTMGEKGVFYASALYLVQNSVIIPVYFTAGFFAVRFILLNKENKRSGRGISEFDRKSYFFYILFFGAFVVIVSLIDVYIAPVLVEMLQ